MNDLAVTNGQFIEALRRGDAAGCAAVYTADGRVFPTHSPMLCGRPAIQAFWQSAIDMGIRDATLETLDLEEQGDVVIETGAYTLEIMPPGGTVTKDEGNYVVIWKQLPEGTWKWHVDVFNTNLPAPV